jgi:hypothetical protein
MAIVTRKLHPHVIRPNQTCLKVHRVVQLDATLIFSSITQNSKFWMPMIEACDARHKLRLSVSRFQVGMALRAGLVRHGAKHAPALVLHMTRGARRRERLVRMMCRCVMTSETCLIRDILKEAASPLHVAQGAFLSEHSVRPRKWPATEDFLTTLRAKREEPHQRDRRHSHRQPETPPPQPMRLRKVHQVNALGPFFGCAYALHWSVLQCHHCVDRSQQQHGIR